ncbi:MAG: MFS transporter [Novosphingobium sp.]
MDRNFIATGWRQIAVGFVLLATVSMIASCYSVVAVPLLAEFKPTRFVLELAMTVLSGTSALLSPYLGNLMDRASLRKMMLIGGGLIAAGYASLSLATSFNHVLIIFGLFIAPANVLLGPMAVTVLLSRWFVRRRGLAIGIAIAGVATGSIVYPLIIRGLLNHFEWRTAFQMLGVILLVVTGLAAMLVVNHPRDRGLHADGDAVEPPSVKAAREAPRVSAAAVLSDPTFWLAAAVFGVVMSGMKGMITNLSPMAIDNGISATMAAGLISVYGTAGLIAKGGFAALADWVNPRILMFISLAGFAAGMTMLTQAHFGYQAIFAGVGLVGMFGGIMVPMQALLMPRLFGEHMVGKAYGLMSGVTLLALMTTPPLFGLIYDVTGSYAAIFLTFAGLAIAVMLAVAVMRMHPRYTANDGGAVAVPAE